MKRRSTFVLSLAVLLGMAAPALMTNGSQAVAAEATEDVLVLNDGRELRGKIISETSTEVIFELINRKSNLKTKLTLDKSTIASIFRDVPLPESEQPKKEESETPAEAPKTTQPSDKPAEGSQQGSEDSDAPEGTSSDPSIPLLYVVPLSGQLGTDIHADLYKQMVDDIRAKKPAVIILTLNSKDFEDLMIPSQGEMGIFDHHMYRDMINIFRDDLRDFRQVMWIKDSVGFVSLIAMSWSEIYMTSKARLGGLQLVAENAKGWTDPDVAAKMMAAWTGIGKGFLEHGGHDLALGEAMMRPEHTLSASFKGRKVVWSLGTDGQYLVDNDEKKTVNFYARGAENLALSKGTVDDIADLAFLLGYQEYRLEQKKPAEVASKYREDWRRAFSMAMEELGNAQQYRQWVGGDEAAKWLGKIKISLEKVLAAMNRYEAVAIRVTQRTRMGKLNIQVQIEQINEQLRSLRNRNNNNGGGGNRGTGTGRGG